MLNEYQKTLYDDLMNLVDSSEAFYYQDFEQWDSWYRIFNYRLASYTEFLAPGALECRGVMFEIKKEGSPEVVTALRLASLPMEKFFNLNENPLTMDLELSTIDLIEEKADGSLISTYVHPNHSGIRLKSKGSLASDQCRAAMLWLSRHPRFEHELYMMSVYAHTINLEWIAPDNRIVIGYAEPDLRVLNIRNNLDGSYVDKNNVHPSYHEIRDRWVDQIVVVNTVGDESVVVNNNQLQTTNLTRFVESIPEMESIEGFVLRLASGQRVKVKTKWYLALHHSKDSINSDRRLYEAVLSEATDDLRSLFFDDPLAIARIEQMEKFVEEKYNHLVDTVERFYERNKKLERKEYAILGQQELDRLQFGLAMRNYLGQEVNYKHFMLAKWKDFGVRDDAELTKLIEVDS